MQVLNQKPPDVIREVENQTVSFLVSRGYLGKLGWAELVTIDQ